MKTLPRKARRKLRSPPEQPEQPNAVMVETGTMFAGLQTFVLVPISSGLDPKVMATEFTKQINKLRAIAAQPDLKELAIMSANNIDKMKSNALGSEN